MNDAAHPPPTPPQGGQFARAGLGLALAVLIVDQLTKAWVLSFFETGPHIVEVAPVFNLVLTWNRGVSFGMFGGMGGFGPWVLSILAVVISLVLLRWLLKTDSRLTALGVSLLIGGAVGNVIDRARFGAVVDFLDFHVGGYHWPAFNVADTAITVGAAVLILEALFTSGETE